ncbi:aminoglycoside 6-adenylyltransferase [Halobacillus naozhouensis]|uniref:Aminoglycoside 6-adenylyltransferase n=1 Tax=Halobacillus naozhouensis TaxID=554880 RepID=A0ABY8IV74_9BACI|nr:aminoglycoside 6-adenylyltransferase [Halobacillus naozhouensis]WFT73606.1 aminoglycoside 6-adenylyltransferase [Halobacillus naozhouensis]
MGFVSKYEQRDLRLPDYRKKLLSSIESDLLNDDHVLAFFYGGSIGNGNTDLYSDIDLRVVVKPEKIKEYISNKKTRPQKWGNILFFEDTNPLSIYTVVHYDCFVKVDTFYYEPNDIQPSNWLKHIKVIKDTNELMADILNKSRALTYEPTFEEFQFWRRKFFAYLHEAYRRVMREEYYYALNCIDHLRLSMSIAWYMDKGLQPNGFGDWAKYEGERSQLEDWQHSFLKSWECGRNALEITNVMKSIVMEFKSVHRSLCNKLEIKEDSAWVNKIIEMVI